MESSTFSFLQNLNENNNKTWFDANRKMYEAARTDFEKLVQTILDKLAVWEEGFTAQRAKDCIFRIHRDVRFSKNKEPYKANFGAVFSKNGKKDIGAGYYLHLEPGKSFVGGGIWQPEKDVLKKIRQEIDYNFSEFEGIISEKKFKSVFQKIDGEPLKRPPLGYDDSNPAIAYLKLKSFTVGARMDDAAFIRKDASEKVVSIFQTMQPFIFFLNRAVE